MEMEALIEKQHVRYTFTEPEIIGMARQQARTVTALRIVEEEKKRATDQYKAKATALQAECSLLASRIESGYEMRQVRILTLKYQPTGDEKLTIRLDNGLVVGRFRLTAEERQMELRDKDFSHAAELLMEDGTEAVRVALYEEEAKALEGLDLAIVRIEDSRLIETTAEESKSTKKGRR